MCGLKHTHKAGRLVPQYDKVTGDPKYKIGKILVPHLDRNLGKLFDNGWDSWFYEVVRDLSRIKVNENFLASIPLEEFRKAFATGGFATLRDAWKQNGGRRRGLGRIKYRVARSGKIPKPNAAARLSTSPSSTVHILERWSIPVVQVLGPGQ
ncbi:hypothetical protein FRC09_012552 [Ceratobasidium sp. 395]|nr:hypothetical protein FRC09_012552 [Ceratobasidium sp. 395]